MYLRGDPDMDREIQSEIDRGGHWKRDVLVFLVGVLILAAIALLAGS